MVEVILTQWEYDHEGNDSEETEAAGQPPSPKKQLFEGLFSTAGRAYITSDKPRKRKRFSFESTPSKSSPENSPRGTNLSKGKGPLYPEHQAVCLSQLSPGKRCVLCVLLDSRFVSDKLQTVLVGDHTSSYLTVKFCGQQLARLAATWVPGTLLYLTGLQVVSEKQGFSAKAIGWGSIRSRAVVVQTVAQSKSASSKVDFTEAVSMGLQSRYCEEVLLPRCRKIASWVRRERSGLLKQFSGSVESVKAHNQVHSIDLSKVTHATVVTIVGRPKSNQLAVVPAKVGSPVKHCFNLCLVNGEQVVVSLHGKHSNRFQVEAIRNRLCVNKFLICRHFRAGWSFREDKIMLTPTNTSALVFQEEAKSVDAALHSELEQARVALLKHQATRLMKFGSIADLQKCVVTDDVQFELEARIVDCEGLPMSKLCCRICGTSAKINGGIYLCPKGCIWDETAVANNIQASEESASSAVPSLDTVFPTTKNVLTPAGYEWRVGDFSVILKDNQDHGALKVKVDSNALNELLCVYPYDLRSQVTAKSYVNKIKHKKNGSLQFLIQVKACDKVVGVPQRITDGMMSLLQVNYKSSFF